MTQHETYLAFAVVAIVAYHFGAKKVTASAPASYDPLAWLNGLSGA